jgi:hypothetical protein
MSLLCLLVTIYRIITSFVGLDISLIKRKNFAVDKKN